MISEETRNSYLKSLRKELKGGHLKVLGYNIDGKGNSGIWTECCHCGKISKRGYAYWLRYPNCYCQRAKNIVTTILAKTDFPSMCKANNVEPLGEYLGRNVRTKVKCLVCHHKWKVWPGNLVKGHSCIECARENVRQNNIDLYWVENASQRQDVIDKRKRTMLKRYGVEHALQNKYLYDKNLKSCFQYKEHKVGNRKVKLQGYEPQAVDYIINNYKINPKNIICGIGSDVPSIEYTYKGKLRIYHPDIFIKSLNRIVEVKSEYTYNSNLKLNKIKRKACLDMGYKFSFFIMDGHGKRINQKDRSN